MTGSVQRGQRAAQWWTRPFGRAVVALAVTLSCTLLPPLSAGRWLSQPPTVDEQHRVEQALRPLPPGNSSSEVARAFYRAAVAGEVAPVPPVAIAGVVQRARLAQLAGLLAIAALLYLVATTAGDRLRAVLACACLALLPPVASEGHLLRSETPATLFAGLALLLWLGFARQAAAPRQRRRPMVLFATAVCAMSANGIAVATTPMFGFVLLVPGLVMTVTAVQLGCRGAAVIKRRSLLHLPHAAINRRLLPWILVSFATLLFAIAMLRATVVGSSSDLEPAYSELPLLGGPLPVRIVCWALLALGAVGMLLRVGIRLWQSARVTAELVLAMYVVAALAIGRRGDGISVDQLPIAPAVALVLAEGVLWAIALLLRLRRTRSAAVRG